MLTKTRPTPKLTARISTAPAPRGSSRYGSGMRRLPTWASKAGVLIILGAVMAMFAITLGGAVTGESQKKVLAGCVAGSDHYNNSPVPSSFLAIDLGQYDSGTWQDFTAEDGTVQNTAQGPAMLPRTAYEYYGSYFPFTSSYRNSKPLNPDANPNFCGNPEGWLGSTIPSLIFAIGSALATVLIAVYSWSTNPALINSLIAPIDCIVAGSSETVTGAGDLQQVTSQTQQALTNFSGDDPAAAANVQGIYQNGFQCNSVGMVNTLYLPYMVPMIFIGAIWMFWKGAVKRRASEVFQAAVWMIGVGALSIVFLVQPTLIAVKLNEAVTYVNNTVVTQIMDVTAPMDSQDVCYIDKEKIQEYLDDWTTTNTSTAAGVSAASATDRYGSVVNNVGPRTASCILWKTLIFDAWVNGQFGSYEASMQPLDVANGNDTKLDYYDKDGAWEESYERRAAIGESLKSKFGPDFVPTLAMAQLEATVLDHDEMVLISRPAADPEADGGAAPAPPATTKFKFQRAASGEAQSAGKCYSVTTEGSSEVTGDEITCPDFAKYVSDYGAWQSSGSDETQFQSYADAADQASSSELVLCLVTGTGVVTNCGTEVRDRGSVQEALDTNAAKDFEAIWYQAADTTDNANWAKLWAGHAPSQRYAAAVTAVIGALIGGIVVTVLGFLNVLYQIGMILLIVVSPLILLVGLHPGMGRRIVIKWMEALLSTATKRILISFLLAILVAIYGSIYSMDVGWLQKVLLIAAVGIGLLMYRKQLTQMIGTVNFGSGGADSFNSGAQQAQRKAQGGAIGGTAAMGAAAIAGGGVGAVAMAGAKGATMSRGGGIMTSGRMGMGTGTSTVNRSKAKKNRNEAQRARSEKQRQAAQQGGAPAGGGRPSGGARPAGGTPRPNTQQPTSPGPCRYCGQPLAVANGAAACRNPQCPSKQNAPTPPTPGRGGGNPPAGGAPSGGGIPTSPPSTPGAGATPQQQAPAAPATAPAGTTATAAPPSTSGAGATPQAPDAGPAAATGGERKPTGDAPQQGGPRPRRTRGPRT